MWLYCHTSGSTLIRCQIALDCMLLRQLTSVGWSFSGARQVMLRSVGQYVDRRYSAKRVTQADRKAAEILSLPSGASSDEQRPDIAFGSCRIAMAVCTAKRPRMLHYCLESLGSQIVRSKTTVYVVVVDNEAEPNNQAFVQEFSRRCRFPVHYLHEPRRGIPQARNAALRKCQDLGVDWIAFTDDDCWVSPTWLASLLDAAARYKADVIYGRREFVFPGPLPFWAMRPEQGVYAEGQELAYAGTHNVLLTARLLGQGGHAGMCFDERLMHGEDTDFFHRAALRGSRIVYSAEPLVLETVLPDRATLSYQTRRAYHYAASRSFFHRRYKGAASAAIKLGARVAFQAPTAVARLAAAPFAWPFSEDAFRDLTTKGTARLAGTVGATMGLFGLVGNPYLHIDGH